MAKYAISFYLKSNDTYGDRYQSLMDAIHRCRRVWTEPTCLALVETDETLVELERRLWMTRFSSVTDLLFVVDVGDGPCSVRGSAQNRTMLKAIMPQLAEH